jgi:hypothetical protein
MEERVNKYFSNIKKGLDGYIKNLDSTHLTFFLGGMAFSMSFILLLSYSGLIGNPFLFSEDKASKVLSKEEVGNMTEKFVNENILGPSPNNVSASFVNAKTPNEINLSGFYRIKLNVSNNAGDQITEIYSKKDGSLVFLQMPRLLGEDYDKQKFN